ncbi:MAG: hypothetical protein LH624_17905, partial [Cryobacterium sp.]|nr:hypothetical protein [Cryobacterium sp.]
MSFQASDDVPVGESLGTTAREVGRGSGFLVSHPQESSASHPGSTPQDNPTISPLWSMSMS